jgi:heavy metal translocating P-type ATPase
VSARRPREPALPDGSLEVQRIGGDRIRVHGCAPESAAATELLAWLGRRAEVKEHAHRADLEVVEIRYEDAPGGRGAFLRALRDRVWAISHPGAPRFSAAIAHALGGRVRLRIEGLDDDAVVRLAAWLAARPGVARASASPASRSILVFFDPEATTARALLDDVLASDKESWPPGLAEPGRTEWRMLALNSVVLAGTISGMAPPPAVAAAVAMTAVPSARRAYRALREGRLSVDVLDLTAIGISLGTGQPLTAAFITWLLGVGDVILAQTTDRARTAISKLMKLDADDAWRITGDGTEKVSVKRLSVGDRVVVEAGGRVPADGIVERGAAMVDEKALTGESVPCERRAGDRVLAASVVVEGQIVIQLDRVGTDTTAAKIVQILEGAGAKPMTLQRETERVADRLVLPTFGVAGAAAFLGSQIDRMTSVLITDFGTGIRIAVPTSALAAMTVAAREGVLVKGGQYLERMSKVDAIVFDKTGTLTGGAPEIFEVVALGPFPEWDVVRFAAAAEARQGHPIAEAIRRHAERARIAVCSAELGSESYTIGAGLSARVEGRHVLVGSLRLMRNHGVPIRRAQAVIDRHKGAGASSLCVAVDGDLAAVIGYADEPRPESRRVVADLKAGSRRQVILLSGDAPGPVAAVAKAVGVDRAVPELLPEDKARYIKELQAAGKTVAMIGDGINDAPALAVADVGISLQGGTDVALETADVVLLEGGLIKLPQAFTIADRAMAHVWRGLGLVIVPNAIAIGLGAMGLITPGIAAAVNNGSTIVAALAGLEPLLRHGKHRP